MIENIDPSLVDWSRGQFALTAMYHWLFVPLTLGLAFIIAFMETIYYRTGKEEWKRMTKFWMILFGVNFAIGVATGIILEFEFGTNWSNYSWFVGDIFGAPLAIEGIMAFFLESTFIAVMFFGWDKVSKKFHLVSTWLVAVGANLSALWILVANAWMQYPVGVKFNPETARNEMINFWEVLFSPVAVTKFLHTITSGFVLAGVFVVGISAWFLLKKREVVFAKKSMLIGGIFGLISTIAVILSGDSSTKQIAEVQPMKFAAIEGLYEGQEGAGLVAIGFFSGGKDESTDEVQQDFAFSLEIPSFLSYMAFGDWQAFVPGVKDMLEGNEEHGILSAREKMERGNYAREKLAQFREAKENGDSATYTEIKALFNEKPFRENYFKYFGYSFIKNPNELIPNVPLSFYSFHLMVLLGGFFMLLFILTLIFLYNGTLEKRRKFLWIALLSIPLPYIAGQAGWIVAEVGRQPWVIQDLMPTVAAISHISASSVQITFWLFAVLFTALFIAEIRIMMKQIRIGPKDGGH